MPKRSKQHAAEQMRDALALHRDAIQVLLNKKPHGRCGQGPLLQLVNLHRYSIDSTQEDATGQKNLAPAGSGAAAALRYNFGYDCVLADGEKKLRCVLSTGLNQMVHGGFIRPGTLVRVIEWVYPRYNCIVMGGGEPLLIVTKMVTCQDEVHTPLFCKFSSLVPADTVFARPGPAAHRGTAFGTRMAIQEPPSRETIGGPSQLLLGSAR